MYKITISSSDGKEWNLFVELPWGDVQIFHLPSPTEALQRARLFFLVHGLDFDEKEKESK